MKVAFVTGTTRGIGLRVAEQLLAAGWNVIGFARSPISFPGNHYLHFQTDLTNPETAEKSLRQALDHVAHNYRDVQKVAVVNNAATLSPTGALANHSMSRLNAGLCLNLAVPMWFSHLVMSSFPQVPCVVLSISSGAAQKPYPGWNFYCASKAALRMSALCLREEAETLGRQAPAKIVIYAPGVVDTDMQSAVRQSSREEFPMVDRFIEYHRTGQLVDPVQPAQEIARFCDMDFTENCLIEDRYPATFQLSANNE